jgi:hypothetical protein
MSNAIRIIHVEPDSELGLLLDKVEESDTVLEKEGVRYRVSRIDAHSARRQHRRLQPERVLDIIGIGESAEGSNIARFKDQYIADATDHRQG